MYSNSQYDEILPAASLLAAGCAAPDVDCGLSARNYLLASRLTAATVMAPIMATAPPAMAMPMRPSFCTSASTIPLRLWACILLGSFERSLSINFFASV